jgi:PAS domain S-box-containing protein
VILLIVDDHPKNLLVLDTLLQKAGFDVVKAHNGKEALALLEETPVDGIISDILMPVMDGFQLCRTIKSDEQWKEIPFIFYTGTYLNEKDKNFALSLGADLFLTKPLEPLELLRNIQNVLRTPHISQSETPPPPEDQYLKEYNVRLIKKLEDKVEQLEKTRRNLSESKKKWQNLFENANDAIFIIDKSGKFLNGNKKVMQLTGYSKNELQHMNFSDFIISPPLLEYQKKLRQVQEGKEIPIFEGCIRTKDGHEIPVEISVSGIENETVKITSIQAIVRDITQRKETEEALIRLASFPEQNPYPVIETDCDGSITYMNPAAREHFPELPVVQTDHPLLMGLDTILTTIKKGRKNFFSREIDLGDTLYEQKIYYVPVTNLIRIFAFDITERKRTEEEMKKRLMKFHLEDGMLYLVPEKIPQISIEAFKDLLQIGYRGIVISRTPEKEFKKLCDRSFEFLWLAEKGGEEALSPRLQKLELKIENLPLKHAILLERIDYLVFKNGFKKTLAFIQRIRELAYIANHIIIFSVDPSLLDEHEFDKIKKETHPVERMHKGKLSDDLLEILQFVYKWNSQGLKPSYTDLEHELDISKPTARKRIRRLIFGGYITEIVKGRRKVLEITEFGNTVLVN